MIEIKVPATTANLGPGFDSMGAALSLYNHLTVEAHPSECLFEFADDQWFIPPEKNLVIEALTYTFSQYNQRPTGYRIRLTHCQIPVSRGLGSSAAAIVSGIYAALYLLQEPLDPEVVLHLATKLEGHPDNAVPAVLGGIISACMEPEKTLYHKIPVYEHLRFIALIPETPLETALARSVLPAHYSRADVVHNLSRVAMLTCALTSGDGTLLRYCMDDRIHEPYRWSLMPDGDRLEKLKKHPLALGGFISGAGSTFMLLCPHEEELILTQQVLQELKYSDHQWRVFPLTIDLQGTQIIEKS